ncbi:hypothetical protein GA0116948_105247 [Chitinophaga costaii]|uniref:Uncharacterized protein n=1 Tax=Chitinophaga costaii TaxID=1335309 RepID=A0A1C4DFF3_9BACT|nr:hypothetical protein DCM91_12000 [Chitinophaga costaii]SCC30099.1 hypothetical protein GA0116948_105247 [Chitinophaga costaii]
MISADDIPMPFKGGIMQRSHHSGFYGSGGLLRMVYEDFPFSKWKDDRMQSISGLRKMAFKKFTQWSVKR